MQGRRRLTHWLQDGYGERGRCFEATPRLVSRLVSRRNAHAVLSRGAVPIPGVPTWSAIRWEGAVVYAGSVDVVSR